MNEEFHGGFHETREVQHSCMKLVVISIVQRDNDRMVPGMPHGAQGFNQSSLLLFYKAKRVRSLQDCELFRKGLAVVARDIFEPIVSRARSARTRPPRRLGRQNFDRARGVFG